MVPLGVRVAGGFRKFSGVCIHNNAIVARNILVTNIALWYTRIATAPSILLLLLEPHWKRSMDHCKNKRSDAPL